MRTITLLTASLTASCALSLLMGCTPTTTFVHSDTALGRVVLYRNGAFEGSVAFADSLSLLNDINNWLGRSQYAVDPSFSGTFHEFRIYNVALSAPAIQTSFLGGPDAGFLD